MGGSICVRAGLDRVELWKTKWQLFSYALQKSQVGKKSTVFLQLNNDLFHHDL